MNRKIYACIFFPVSLLKNLTYKILSLNRINIGLLCFISFSSKIRNSGGRVKIGSKLWMEPNSIIKSVKGSINIDNNVFINKNFTMVSMSKVTIGRNCLFGPNVSIFDHDHELSVDKRDLFKVSDVIIGDNVWVGSSVTILKGVTISSGSVVAAGSVVNKDIPSGELWGGVPARFIRNL